MHIASATYFFMDIASVVIFFLAKALISQPTRQLISLNKGNFGEKSADFKPTESQGQKNWQVTWTPIKQ